MSYFMQVNWTIDTSGHAKREEDSGRNGNGCRATPSPLLLMGSERVTQLLRLHQKFMQNPGLTVPANQLCNRANVLPARIRESKGSRDLVKRYLIFHALATKLHVLARELAAD